MHDGTARAARFQTGRVITRREALGTAKVFLAGVVACGFMSSSAPSFAQGRANVTIKNKSQWEIHHLFLSATTESEWGPDQLGDNIISAEGGTFLLKNIPCDSYDVKLVDEDGDECVVEDVDLCGSSEGWVITNDDLLECEGDGEARCPTSGT
jgi:hypothetical protein